MAKLEWENFHSLGRKWIFTGKIVIATEANTESDRLTIENLRENIHDWVKNCSHSKVMPYMVYS